MSKKFIKKIEVNRYILWQIDEKNSVFLFKDEDVFLISSFMNGVYKSVLFKVNESGSAEVLEKEGVFEENFNFDIYYAELQEKTKDVEGLLI